MPTRTERRLVVTLIASLFVLALNALWEGWALRSMIHANLWNAHTYEVLAHLGTCQSLLLDADGAVQDYIVTGRPNDVVTYGAARSRIWDEVAQAQRLTVDNPRQQPRFPQLHQLIAARLQLLAESVDLYRRHQAETAARLMASGREEQVDIETRNLFAVMRQEEQRLAGLRGARVVAGQHAAAFAFVFANAVALGVLAAVWFLAHRIADERARHDREMLEQQEWLSTTLASIGDGVLATDSDGIIRFVNAVTARLTGWRVHEAVGRPVGEVFHIVNEYTRAEVENPAFRALREGLVVGLANHTLLISRHGAATPIDDSAAPIRAADGKVLGVVLVFRDVTERKQVEAEREHLLAAERQARYEAESASRAKDSFLATVSHELRTPLGAILGWAGILRSTEPNAATIARAAEVIERNAHAQTKIVDDILDIARIVAGKLKMQFTEVNPVDTTEAAVESQRPAAADKGVAMTLSVGPDIAPIFADPDRLQQIVWNLLSNAIKFTPRGGHIEVGILRRDDKVHIVVSDQGVGIAPERLPHVFERFWQADSGTTRRHGGLGLGLAIVRQLVEVHGGTVHVASEGEGRGATFTVAFPVRSTGDLANARRAANAGLSLAEPLLMRQDLRRRRILIVDDEPDNAEWAGELLRAAGADIRIAHSAQEGFDTLRAWRPELLISDIGMPEEDGFSLMKRIRALPAAEGGQTVALALTAHASAEDRVKALSIGYHMHTPKPVDPVELLIVAASLLDRAT